MEAATAAAERNPEALIQSIQAKQKELSQVIQNLENNISAMISAATGIAGGTEAVMDRMEYYRTIDLSYSQQITLLERQQELNHQLTTGQVDAGQAELEEPVPFLELDRMRAELEQRSHQQETLARKVELAEAVAAGTGSTEGAPESTGNTAGSTQFCPGARTGASTGCHADNADRHQKRLERCSCSRWNWRMRDWRALCFSRQAGTTPESD